MRLGVGRAIVVMALVPQSHIQLFIHKNKNYTWALNRRATMLHQLKKKAQNDINQIYIYYY